MAQITIELTETFEGLLGQHTARQPIAHINVSDAIAREIEAGAALVHLPGEDESTGRVLEAKAPIKLPLLGHADIDVAISVTF
jgi:hypothetical protein